MRLLLIHADYLEYEVKQPTAVAEEVPKEKRSGRFEEVLVVFTAVEETDEQNENLVVQKAATEIKGVAERVNAERIVVYPYAHLSPTLAAPSVAVRILDKLREALRDFGFEVYRLPFGWYKGFKLSCKGHPLSELSKQIAVEAVEGTAALREEETVVSSWYILEPNGELYELKLEDNEVVGYDFKDKENLRLFALHEMARRREASGEPPHVELMRRLELVDYETGSDSGNFKFYPKGRLIKKLLERWVGTSVAEYGAMEIETPIMYDHNHPALKDYLDRFPARQYTLKSGKRKLFLRFSACFGQFLLLSASTISYRHLPLRIYELTRYSFRLEKSGELSGLRRLRSFTMPDMHTICRDLEQAKEEFKKQFEFSMRCLAKLGFSPDDYETGIRMTREFWDKHRDFVISLVQTVGKPVLLEIWNRRYAYFDPKFEFNFIDAIGKASALSTVQMDHENAERYGIFYVDEENQRRHPIILHCSPTGSLERVLYALLEKAYKQQKAGGVPSLPLWLSPTQIRLIPLADRHLEFCERLADELESGGIRVDIDDRAETVPKKVREAERDWVPYIVVVGDQEVTSGVLQVRIREKREMKQMSAQELKEEILKQVKGMPTESLGLPRKLSARPVFVRA